MKLQQLTLNNIRNFFTETTFDFSESTNINTISGINGSGKTTIFKCLILCQKAYFLNLLTPSEYLDSVKQEFKNELSKYLSKVNGFIEVKFDHPNSEHQNDISTLRLAYTYSKDLGYLWNLVVDEASSILISQHWNLAKPENIILYISSNKYFREESVLHSNISIPSSDKYNQLVIDTIINPEAAFSNIYQSLVIDYLRERLVPGTPRKDLYFTITKALLKKVMPHVDLANFSGQEFPEQFVLLGKSSTNDKSYLYDIRNLSSGEKVLLNTIMFINYIPKIGVLIIDEPENHLHEESLVKFVKMLADICQSNSYLEYIKANVQTRSGNGKTNDEQVKTKDIFEKVYGNHKLSQVYLLTHSKNLVYNNFTNGTNFYINNGLEVLKFKSFESTLRGAGLSSIYSKVLFVEGSTEENVLEPFFNEHNIKVKSLNGSSQVIDTYNRLLTIKQYLYNYHFCFVIDHDTQNDKKTKKLRNEDTDFFDDHFMILDRHELENYLLDAKLFETLITKHKEEDNTIVSMTAAQIEADILAIATNDRTRVFRKALQELNDLSITELKPELVKKEPPINDLVTYQAHIETLVNGPIKGLDIEEFLLEKFIANFQKLQTTYNGQDWTNKWKSICDGKSVYNQVITKYAIHMGLTRDRLEREMVATIKKTGSFDINPIINDLIGRFNS